MLCEGRVPPTFKFIAAPLGRSSKLRSGELIIIQHIGISTTLDISSEF